MLYQNLHLFRLSISGVHAHVNSSMNGENTLLMQHRCCNTRIEKEEKKRGDVVRSNLNIE
jgi:hypothetical protein